MSQDSDRTLPMEEDLMILYNPGELQHTFQYRVLKSFQIGKKEKSRHQFLNGDTLYISIYDNYMSIEGKRETASIDMESEQAIDTLDSLELRHIERLN